MDVEKGNYKVRILAYFSGVGRASKIEDEPTQENFQKAYGDILVAAGFSDNDARAISEVDLSSNAWRIIDESARFSKAMGAAAIVMPRLQELITEAKGKKEEIKAHRYVDYLCYMGAGFLIHSSGNEVNGESLSRVLRAAGIAIDPQLVGEYSGLANEAIRQLEAGYLAQTA